jgi:hypothetical protein
MVTADGSGARQSCGWRDSDAKMSTRPGGGAPTWLHGLPGGIGFTRWSSNRVELGMKHVGGCDFLSFGELDWRRLSESLARERDLPDAP